MAKTTKSAAHSNGKRSAPKKARKKSSSAPRQPKLIPQPNGKGALFSGGVPGNKGGGRPPDEFKLRMARLASSDVSDTYLEACLRGDHGPKAFIAARNYATDRGYGRVPTVNKIIGDAGEPLQIQVVHR